MSFSAKILPLPYPTLAPSSQRPSSKRDRRYIAAALTAIILIGLSLRSYQLSTRSIWFDEAFSWRLIQFPFVELMQRIGQDNHPPLYFLILKVWASAFGDLDFPTNGERSEKSVSSS